MENIPKLCADSLRAFTKDKYGVDVKSSHAHELVAAFFGYKSKIALLADAKYPVSNLQQAEIIVMAPDAFVDDRRKRLEGLSPDLPDSYTLGDAVYTPLFAGPWWASHYPPFRSFDKLAKFLVENNDTYQSVFKLVQSVPMNHIVDIKIIEESVQLTVLHAHQTAGEEMLLAGSTTIKLQRVAGCIGYGRPQISVERRAGLAREKFKFVEARQ